jgi:CheY-like chemotaxis protein
MLGNWAGHFTHRVVKSPDLGAWIGGPDREYLYILFIYNSIDFWPKMARIMLIDFIRIIVMIRILILDDEKLIRWSLDKILAQDGYAVDTAATTGEALALAAKADYALVLTDLEICGDAARPFFTELLEKQRQARVITLTAMPRDEAEKTLDGIPTYAIIEKPFTSEAIRGAVHAALASIDEPSTSPIKESHG